MLGEVSVGVHLSVFGEDVSYQGVNVQGKAWTSPYTTKCQRCSYGRIGLAALDLSDPPRADLIQTSNWGELWAKALSLVTILVDMWIDMWIDMRIDMRINMRINKIVDMRTSAYSMI